MSMSFSVKTAEDNNAESGKKLKIPHDYPE